MGRVEALAFGLAEDDALGFALRRGFGVAVAAPPADWPSAGSRLTSSGATRLASAGARLKRVMSKEAISAALEVPRHEDQAAGTIAGVHLVWNQALHVRLGGALCQQVGAYLAGRLAKRERLRLCKAVGQREVLLPLLDLLGGGLGLREPEHPPGDVAGEHLDVPALEEPGVAEQDRDRVGLLAGRAARGEDAQAPLARERVRSLRERIPFAG